MITKIKRALSLLFLESTLKKIIYILIIIILFLFIFNGLKIEDGYIGNWDLIQENYNKIPSLKGLSK